MEDDIYDVYHDESTADGYWHGFLFVPRQNRDQLLSLLHQARCNIDTFKEVRFGNIRAKQKPGTRKVKIAKCWLSIGFTSLQQQKLEKYPPYVFLGRIEGEPVYRELDDLLRVKFAVFKERDAHKNCYFAHDPLRNIETTFRMGLKGGLHRLFSTTDPITIGNVYIDGDEHYYSLYDRTMNPDNVVGRIRNESRDYVNLLDDTFIIPQRSNSYKIKPEQSAENSELLQLCDLLLGAVRINCVPNQSPDIRLEITSQYRNLLQYDLENYARMQESRFFNGFTFGETWIDGGEWQFGSLNVYDDSTPPSQPSLI